MTSLMIQYLTPVLLNKTLARPQEYGINRICVKLLLNVLHSYPVGLDVNFLSAPSSTSIQEWVESLLIKYAINTNVSCPAHIAY